jgi:hypothetical protein
MAIVDPLSDAAPSGSSTIVRSQRQVVQGPRPAPAVGAEPPLFARLRHGPPSAGALHGVTDGAVETD